MGTSGGGVRFITLLCAAALVAAACTGDSSEERTSSFQPSPATLPRIPHGGTLRVVVPIDSAPIPFSILAAQRPNPAVLDPQLDWFTGNWFDSPEIMRCCLSRTLLSYYGRPTDEGGTELQPDLARSLPDVSEDGLVWTFHLKAGIRYGPPLQDTEITSPDFVRALERTISPDVGSIDDLNIQGAREFWEQKATTITGLETPDDHTLVIRLNHPAGDFGDEMSLPYTAPIPPSPNDPGAPFGTAEGHNKGYGRFLVSSGPYMLEGSDELDFGVPAPKQRPVAGFIPGKSVTLVGNPSWDPATDPLRPAYVDRIEVTVGGTQEEAAAEVDAGRADLALFVGTQTSLATQIKEFRADPSKGHVNQDRNDQIERIEMNVAIPPFDDVHVRRAVNWAIDKQRLVNIVADWIGGPFYGTVAPHMAPDALEDNLLLSYDPFATRGNHGDLDKAKAEMSKSRYDTDHDGLCDSPECRGIPTEQHMRRAYPKLGREVKRELKAIGLELDLMDVKTEEMFDVWNSIPPKPRMAMFVGIAAFGIRTAASLWRNNFYSRTALGEIFKNGTLVGEFRNGTLVGASTDQLRRWGYSVTSVPNIDDRIERCLPTTGNAAFQCWAALDQYVTEAITPWVSFRFGQSVHTTSNRVVHYSFDQQLLEPAFDQIAVQG